MSVERGGWGKGTNGGRERGRERGRGKGAEKEGGAKRFIKCVHICMCVDAILTPG